MRILKLVLFCITGYLLLNYLIIPKKIKVFLAGDSTIAEKLIEKRPETGWGEKFGMFFNENIEIENHAKNGRSTRTFLEEGRWQKIIENVSPGDYVFIQFGHNDQSEHKKDRYTPPDKFKSNLRMFANDCIQEGAIPILVTPVMRRRFDDVGKFYDVHGVYPELVKEVANELNIALIDLHKKSEKLFTELGEEKSKELFLILEPNKHKNYPNGINDNTHFSDYGAKVIAKLVVDEINRSNLGLKEYIINRPENERADLIVSQDGTANFRSIQEAIESIKNADELTTIYIKNGIYHEKLSLHNSNIALVGENKDSTIIEYAELRKNYLKYNSDSFGSATINIDSTANNITLANLTIHNNYGSLFGDHDHQFAIYGLGTKIIIVNCNIIADGGDTVSLWNQENGMYYHSNCYFEGWVDYVCPRGWCYITDSKFYGHNLTASLWHKGIGDEDQKFVIRYSYFDGVPGFPLGRHHSDGQFYLLDCIFSENMADIPIFWPVSPNAKEWIWGKRHYYYNSHRIGGDYEWFADNLEEAKNSPTPEEIDAKWTFKGKWDPEAEMPSVLPFVYLPKPRDAAYNIATDSLKLTWIHSRNADSFNIYFWKSKFPQALGKGEKLKDGPAATGAPTFIKNQIESYYIPDKLEKNSTYYWRIDEIAGEEIIEGPLWHFTTVKHEE